MKLWYKRPASEWTEALPLGNGRIGAMVYGDPLNETICLNEDSLWSGYPKDSGVCDPWPYLQNVRKLVADEKYSEADEEIEKHLLGRYSESYLPMGNIYIDCPCGKVTDYYRDLDLDNAISHTRFVINGAKQEREAFVSAADQAFVMRMTSEKGGDICFDIRADSQLRSKVTCEPFPGAGISIAVEGIAPSEDFPDYSGISDPVRYEDSDDKKGMKFGFLIVVITKCGVVYKDGSALKIRDADCAEIRVFARTSFNGPDRQPYTCGTDYRKALERDISKAYSISYEELRSRHIQDYSTFITRVDIEFDGGKPEDELPLDERLEEFKTGNSDPYLYSLFYQYGRYLKIASSREGTLPANLQGIWSDKLQPPFSCNYTTNINLEMNYWGTEEENLSELNEPLFSFIWELADSGRKTAAGFYHARGSVVHHNTDIWAMTYPVGHDLRGMASCGFWNQGFGWLCRHLYEHYEYSLDLDFLRDRCLPMLTQAARFYLDVLVEGEGGHLVMPPSSSPENAFEYEGKVCHNTSMTVMSTAIEREVFNEYLRTVEILRDTDQKSDDENAEKEACTKCDDLFGETAKALAKLPSYKIGSRGQILEWDKEFREHEVSHRHISHLYALYPGRAESIYDNNCSNNQVCKAKMTSMVNIAFYDACRVSLEERGDAGTGWSLGWKMNAWARLGDGDRALCILKKMLQLTRTQKMSVTASADQGSGVYANLFDAHPPFQIDGNFAAAAGISEMLVQSYLECNNEVIIKILPALPREMGTGHAYGIRTKGQLTLDIDFSDCILTKLTVHSYYDEVQEVKFLYRGNIFQEEIEGNKTVNVVLAKENIAGSV